MVVESTFELLSGLHRITNSLFRQGKKLKLSVYDTNVNAPIQCPTVIEELSSSFKIDKRGSFKLLPTVQRWRDKQDHQGKFTLLSTV